MSSFKLFVRNRGNKRATDEMRRKLETLKFNDAFISDLAGSRKAKDVTEELGEMTRLGVLTGDKKDYFPDLVVRVRSEKTGKYITSPYVYDNILKQVIIADPTSFKSISKRASVKGNLKLLEKYEKAYQKPFYAFTKNEAEKVVGDLSKGDRTPITIKAIIKNASVIEQKIFTYVKEYVGSYKSTRTFTRIWAKISLNDITEETDRKFLTKNDIDNLVNRGVFGERNAQYTTLALLTFKGVRIDKYPENNEMALIKLADIDVDKKLIKVGVNDYQRKIKFDDGEWQIIKRAINWHEQKKGVYLFQPFKTTRTVNEPLTRWSLVQRLHDLSKEIYGNPNTAQYKTIRLSGLNYLFAKDLMDNGILLSTRARNANIKVIAIKCLQQFGDLPTWKVGQIRKATVKTKIDRLKLNAMQYSKSF